MTQPFTFVLPSASFTSRLKKWFVGDSQIKSYRQDRLVGFFLMLPMMLLIALLSFYPVARVLSMSVRQQSLYSAESVFVGFQNWVTLVNEPIFLQALVNNLVFGFGSLFAQRTIGPRFAGSRRIRAEQYLSK